ncbi:hypothetical protein CBQ26_13740 [Deinococcus indicus]|uniref:Uncharacterized protein n=1 Tax=Deinococcus indicus TaxID=223556 RepID=A0A246BIL5_9DEIO|nr:hypothetical protein CBQ26_13740 [Deinococcus indicus]
MTFTGSGTVKNYTPDTEYTLTSADDLSKGKLGTLKADKTVTVTVTPDMISKFGMYTTQGFYDGMKALNCDVSKLQIVNVEYGRISDLNFTTTGGTKSFIEMSVQTPNADGTVKIKKTTFSYSKGNGSIKGSVSCPGGFSGIYNMVMKPGWNESVSFHTYNPATKTASPYTYDIVSQKTTYSGDWNAFSR